MSSKIPDWHITRGELDAARLSLLRRRFVTFARIVGLLVIVKTVLVASIAFANHLILSLPLQIVFISKILLGIAIFCLPFMFKRRLKQLDQRQILLRAGILIVIAVITQVTGAEVLGRLITNLLTQFGIEHTVSPVGPLMMILGLIYTAAALTVPWHFREALWPLLAALGILVCAMLIDRDAQWLRPSHLNYLAMAGAPGLLISWVRSSHIRERIALRALAGRYQSIYSDLEAARRIHEALFPAEITRGPVQFAYRYRPAREIGGDFLAAIKDTNGGLTLALIDVTGHGVAAALAVNRLHGEIKRVTAEHPDAGPREFVIALNHYMFLTLSDEHLYATGVVVHFDPEKKLLRVCNAGHPAPLLRRSDGSVHKFDANAAMLGILDGDAFITTEHTLPIDTDDRVLLYTDGAVEAMSGQEQILGIAGLTRRLQKSANTDPSALAREIEESVQAYSDGGLLDDTLIAIARLSDEKPDNS